MSKPEIKDWYEHPQSIFVMFTKELKIVWSPSGNELRRVYLLEPDAFVSGPLELPIPDEVKELSGTTWTTFRRRFSSTMRCLFFLIAFSLAVLSVPFAQAEESAAFAKVLKPFLIIREGPPAAAERPATLQVYLRPENIGDSSVCWLGNNVSGVEAEVLDPDGKPAPFPPSAASITYNDEYLVVPYGSRLDWLISHGGVSVALPKAETEKNYFLTLGGRGWIIPKDQASAYTLRIRLHGIPWQRAGIGELSPEAKREMEKTLLLDLPATPIKVFEAARGVSAS